MVKVAWWLKRTGKTPVRPKYRNGRKFLNPDLRSIIRSGRPPHHLRYPQFDSFLKEFVAINDVQAPRDRDTDIGVSETTLVQCKQYLEAKIPGLTVSLQVVARSFNHPRKKGEPNTKYAYRCAVDAYRARIRNNLRKHDPDAHSWHSRFNQARQYGEHFGDVTYTVSCDNKNKVPLGVLCVSHFVNKEGYSLKTTIDVPDHDFATGSGKIVPMGTLLLPPYPKPTLIADKLGRPCYKVRNSGQLLVTLRAEPFSRSTIQPHVNDLIRCLPSEMGTRSILNILADNGPDWNPNHLINQLYYCRLFRVLDLDAMIVATQCPGYSAFNIIEHAWSRLTKSLAGVRLDATYPGDTVVPEKLSLRKNTPVQILQKAVYVFEKAMSFVRVVWSGLFYGSNDAGMPLTVKVEVEPCMKPFDPFHDHADLQAQLRGDPSQVHADPKTSAELRWMQQHVVKRNMFLVIKKCESCSYCTASPVKARAAFDFLCKEKLFPNPTLDPMHTGHFYTFIDHLNGMPIETEPDVNSLRQQRISTTLKQDRCPYCPLYMFCSKDGAERHMVLFHPDLLNPFAKEQRPPKVKGVAKGKIGLKVNLHRSPKNANPIDDENPKSKRVTQETAAKTKNKPKPRKPHDLRKFRDKLRLLGDDVDVLDDV